jgi:hypothetical protein
MAVATGAAVVFQIAFEDMATDVIGDLLAAVEGMGQVRFVRWLDAPRDVLDALKEQMAEELVGDEVFVAAVELLDDPVVDVGEELVFAIGDGCFHQWCGWRGEILRWPLARRRWISRWF